MNEIMNLHRPSACDPLTQLLERICACRICVESPMGKPLPHAPRPVVIASAKASILIAGQAPGLRVHVTGIPFNDPSGDRLRQWLAVDRDSFYNRDHFAIVPMGFCFPGQDSKGGDLPPRRECAPAWRGEILRLTPQIRLILAIGQYAHAAHLGRLRRRTLTETVADWRRILAESAGYGPEILPLPHPSWRNSGWIRRNPWFEAELLPVLRQRVRQCLSQAEQAVNGYSASD